jgi:hypothetical protein
VNANTLYRHFASKDVLVAAPLAALRALADSAAGITR